MAREKWEAVLKKIDALVATSNATLYDRAKLLKQVWEDPEFFAFHGNVAEKAEGHLNQKLGDQRFDVHEILLMLKFFPQREQWQNSNLSLLLASALEKDEGEREEKKQPKHERKGPVPRKEFERAEAELRHVNSRADSLAEENGRLRAEITRLKTELDKSLGRIEELERVLNRQFAGA